MFDIFNCCSSRIKNLKSGNIIDKNDREYNLSCFYFTNKENNENKRNILLSSILIQTSYYPLFYWNDYFEKFKCMSQPRDRFKSLDCETNFQEVDLYTSIPTNREKFNQNDISPNNRILYESLIADHIKPIREKGAKWDKNNIQVICKQHHMIKTNQEKAKYKR